MQIMESRTDFYDNQIRNRASVEAFEDGLVNEPSIVTHYGATKRAYSVRRLTAAALINAANVAARSGFRFSITDSKGRLFSVSTDERKALANSRRATNVAREIVARVKARETAI